MQRQTDELEGERSRSTKAEAGAVGARAARAAEAVGRRGFAFRQLGSERALARMVQRATLVHTLVHNACAVQYMRE